MSSFLMNSGYSGVDPKFPPSDDYSQSSYLSQHSEYYNHMQAAQHYGYGATAAAMSGYPAPRDPMGYASNYYQQCSAMTPQQVHNNLIEFQSLDNFIWISKVSIDVGNNITNVQGIE